jgi:hypothetical protein
MKTVKELKSMIQEIISDSMYLEEKYKAKSRKRVQFLNECVLYLEHNPTEDFLYKQLNDLNKQLEAILKTAPEHFESKAHEYKWMNQHKIQKIKDPAQRYRTY